MKKRCPTCSKRFVTSKKDMESKKSQRWGNEFITTCRPCLDYYLAEEAAAMQEAEMWQYQMRIGSEY